MQSTTLNNINKKVAFVFPGQGAQAVGMGKEIIESYPESKEIFERASKVLDFDLETLCFEENDKINQTQYTQPALLAVCIAILKAVELKGIKADYVAGLSLGEYTALVANSVFTLEDAVQLVRKRGLFMEEAAAATDGSMAAVMGSSEEVLKSVFEQVQGQVQIANYNSPSQLVISGEKTAVAESVKLLADMKVRAIPLNVSGAFHSTLMESAGVKLKDVLDGVEIHDFAIPYIANVTAGIVNQKEIIKELLVKQVASSVRWEESVHRLIEAGVEVFIEIGPSKTLSGLIKKIDKSVTIYNVEDINSLNALNALLEG